MINTIIIYLTYDVRYIDLISAFNRRKKVILPPIYGVEFV